MRMIVIVGLAVAIAVAALVVTRPSELMARQCEWEPIVEV